MMKGKIEEAASCEQGITILLNGGLGKHYLKNICQVVSLSCAIYFLIRQFYNNVDNNYCYDIQIFYICILSCKHGRITLKTYPETNNKLLM